MLSHMRLEIQQLVNKPGEKGFATSNERYVRIK